MHTHDHHEVGPEERNRYLRLAPFSLTVSVVEYAAGYFGGSALLRADALHTFFDLLENLLNAAVAERARRKKREAVIRRLGFLGSALLIGSATGLMAHESWEKLSHPTVSPLPVWTVGVALFALVMNLIMWRIHEAAPRHHRNVTHFAQHLHLATDIGASAVAIAGVLIASLTSWTTADAWGGLIIIMVVWVRLAKGVYDLFVGNQSAAARQRYRDRG